MQKREQKGSSQELFRTQITGPDLNIVGESPKPSLGKPELSFRTEVGGHNSDSVKMVVSDEVAARVLNDLLHTARGQRKKLFISITAEDY